MRFVPTLFLIAIVAGAWNYVSTRPISHAQGAIAPAAPVQVDRVDLPSFRVGNYDIKSAAEFSLLDRLQISQAIVSISTAGRSGLRSRFPTLSRTAPTCT